MNRRTLLGRILGGAVVTPSLTIEDAAKVLGLSSARAPTSEILDHVAASPPMSYRQNQLDQAMNALWRTRHLETSEANNEREMPVEIATKKSWSPAFKASEWRREKLIWMALEDKIRSDEALQQKLADILGGGS